MPRLPTITASPGAAPVISPEAFGAGAARALTGLGDQFTQIATTLQHRQDELDVVEGRASYDQALADARLSLQQNTDYQQHPSLFLKDEERIRQQTLARYKRPAVRSALQVYMTSEAGRQMIEVKTQALQLWNNSQLAGLDRTEQQLAADAARSGPEGRRGALIMQRSLVDRFEQSGMLTPTDAEKKRQSFDRTVQYGAAIQDARIDPIGTLDHLAERYPSLDALQMEAVLSRAVAEDARQQRAVDKLMKETKDQAVLDDAIAAASGNLTLDQLTARARQFRYTDEDYAKLRSDIEQGGTTNPHTLIHYETAIRTLVPVSVRELSGRLDLSNADKIRLMSLLDSQKNEAHFSKTPVYQEAVKELRTAISRKGPLESLDPQEQKTLLYTSQELWNRAAKGEDPLSVARELIKRVPSDQGFGVGLPALLPKYSTEQDLVKAFNAGQISMDEFNREALLFQQLRENQAIEQNAAARQQRLEQGRNR